MLFSVSSVATLGSRQKRGGEQAHTELSSDESGCVVCRAPVEREMEQLGYGGPGLAFFLSWLHSSALSGITAAAELRVSQYDKLHHLSSLVLLAASFGARVLCLSVTVGLVEVCGTRAAASLEQTRPRHRIFFLYCSNGNLAKRAIT